MVFSSTVFMFIFLPICLMVYALLRKTELRNAWLLIVSIAFYAWGEPKWVFLLGISTIVNYLTGLLLGRAKEKKTRSLVLALACVYNIAILFWFKYLAFSVSIIDNALGTSLYSNHEWISKIVMPIGISFFTFQIMSYVIDVYRKQVPVQKNPFKLGLYIMLFPQMIAGPIVRYSDVVNEIDHRRITLDETYKGVRRFMVGFIKKVIISNRMAEVADIVFGMQNPSGAVAWLGIICYALQIFFDFSAYSDMAIGMGHMFGFHFLENFNYPYIAKSVQEFWRRWHISLSSWFKDYLYIPLGGNRKGRFKTYRNLLIVFFTTGLWHGASWNFIIWGLFHGAFQLLERFGFFKRIYKQIPWPMQWMYTMLVVLVGWVFFRADNLSLAVAYLGNMFVPASFGLNQALFMLHAERICILILGLILSMPVYPFVEKRCNTGAKAVALDVLLFVGFFVALLYLTGSSFNPFIYFRF